MNRLKNYLMLTVLAGAAACGVAPPSSPTQEQSRLQSLTGFPEGTKWPCQDYNVALGANQWACLSLPEAGSSHPAIDVLVELRGFDAATSSKVKEALAIFNRHWNDTHDEAISVNDTSFGRCLDVKVQNDMFAAQTTWPVEHRTKARAISWAVLNLQYMFEKHAETKKPLIIAATNEPGIMGQASTGSEGWNETSGDIELALPALLISDYTAKTFAGTLMHEWLHRKGYNHPRTGYDDPVYVATMTVAAGICVRNDNDPFGLALAGGGPEILPE